MILDWSVMNSTQRQHVWHVGAQYSPQLLRKAFAALRFQLEEDEI